LLLRGSLLTVCKKCFVSSSKMQDNGSVSLRGGASVRNIKNRASDVTVKVEDRLEPIPDLGKVVMERRTSLGLSVQDLSARAGIRESLIKKVESGKIVLPIQDLKRLERVLGISLIRVSESEDFYKVGSRTSSYSKNKGLTLGDLLAKS